MATDRRQITRTRISYSCQTCRRRKVKCDKAHPICGGCQKVGETCIYGEGDSIDQPNDDIQQRKRKADVSSREELEGQSSVSIDMTSFRALENKLNHLNALMNEMGHSKTPDANQSSHEKLRASPNTPARPSIGSIYSAQHILPRETTGQNGTSVDTEKISVFDSLLVKLDQVNAMLKHNTLKLTQPSPNTKIRDEPRSTTSTQLLMQLHRELVTDTPDGIVREERELQHSLVRELVEKVSDNDILAPTHEECNVLFRSWLWSTYVILPLISPHDVLRKYLEFRKWYESGLDHGLPNPDPSFMPLLTAVWYAGMSNLTVKGHQKWFPWANSERLTLAMRTRLRVAAQTTMYPAKPTPMSIAASVNIGYLLSQDHDKVQNSAEITAIMRAAQIMGLHNERTFQHLPLGVAETRRRLFWEVTHQDVSLSAVSGMPPILDEFYADTALPSELKDSLLGTDTANEYEARLNSSDANPDQTDDPLSIESSSMVSVHHLVSKARYIIAAATRKVLKFNMGARQMTMDDLKAIRRVLSTTSKDVRAIIDRITTRGVPEMDFVPQVIPFASADHHDSMGAPITAEEIDFFLGKRTSADAIPFARHHRMITAAFHKWARIALSLMLDRLSCLSYAPFLKNAKSRLWGVARNCALKDCHAFLRKFISLGTDPELERFRWCWPVLFQPMHAAIIVLIDVYERPFSHEAPRSRAFIDKLFILATPENGIVGVKNGVTIALPLREGGVEAWDMLRNLRQKAWQKAGLDPELLWTEEDQIEVGVSAPLSENQRFIQSLREDVVVKYNEIRGSKKSEEQGMNERATTTSTLQNAAMQATWMDAMHPLQVDVTEANVNDSYPTETTESHHETEKQQHLLLRARHDQQLMPYPFGNKGSITHSEAEVAGARRALKGGYDTGEITHVSELIKKIKSMKANLGQGQSNNDGSQSGLDQSGVDSPNLNLFPDSGMQYSSRNPSQSEQFECNFRKDRELEDAALGDILDHSFIRPDIRDLSSKTGLPQQRRMMNKPTDSAQQNATSSSNFPLFLQSQTHLGGFAQLATQHSDTSSVQSDRHAQDHHPQHTAYNRQRSFFYGSTLQPQFAEPSRDDAESPSEPPTNPSLETGSSTYQDFAPSTNTSAPTEVTGPFDTEFDWEKWDEVFSGFTGFEDLLESSDNSWMTDDHATAEGRASGTSFWGVPAG